jgi:hypothetical protein
MSQHLTNKQLAAMQGKAIATGIMNIESLVELYEERRMQLVNQHPPPYSEAIKQRMLVNQSVISYLNALILLSNIKAGRSALQQVGLSIKTSDAKREQLRKKL